MKVRELIDAIRKRDLTLPEFQREYVWTLDQSKQLISSLYKGYPVGGLLFWKTDNPPELKNITALPQRLGTIEVILDGQQRLTTLYMLLTGEIPPYYVERDITHDPRHLYFNLDEGDFQYYQPSRMDGNDLWHRVVDCFPQAVNVFQIAQNRAANNEDSFQLAQRYNDNLTRLRQIQELDLPVQVVPVDATIERAIDIFDLVNSQGTKLTDAELALTHVTGKWPQARRILKDKITKLEAQHFYFDLTFVTRALTGVVTNRALYEHIHSRPKPELVAGWNNLSQILDYLASVLPGHAFIHSTEDINSPNVLIPIVVYLSLHDQHFADETSLKQAIRWLYLANIWSRYAGQTDQRLEKDVQWVVREESPWAALCDEIVDQRGRIQVDPNDLEGHGTQNPLFKMAYVIAKSQGAVDWFNGVPLTAAGGPHYRIHKHHIFPQALLYKNGYEADNHLHRKIVNEIANLAFLTADSNLSLADSDPAMYLPRINDRYPGALAHQFIPMDPALWKVESYEDFLTARRKLISLKINEYLNGMIAKPEPTRHRPIIELIKLGEGLTLEFKSTLQWDVVEKKQNTALRLMVLKTIAAFLNSEGGTLVIGVEDNGSIYGVENDLKTIGKHDLDGFQQVLSGLIADNIGADYGRLVKVRFEKIDGKQVCAVEVDKAPEPVYTKGKDGRPEFVVRLNNTTQPLDVLEATRYIQQHWE